MYSNYNKEKLLHKKLLGLLQLLGHFQLKDILEKGGNVIQKMIFFCTI